MKLQDEELKRKEELTTTESQKEELKRQLFKEVTAYKVLYPVTFTWRYFVYPIPIQEQSEQYATTIVALEEKLLQLMDKCKSLQNENIELAEKLSVETTTCQREVKGMSNFILILLYTMERLRVQGIRLSLSMRE